MIMGSRLKDMVMVEIKKGGKRIGGERNYYKQDKREKTAKRAASRSWQI